MKTGILRLPAAVFLVCLAFGNPLPAQPKTRTLRIGLYENAPKVGTDATGKPSGIFVDVIGYIAAKENWNLEYVQGTWAEGLARLASGAIDLMPDVARTPERERDYALHALPVLSSWFQVYARKGSGIQSILDLKNKTVAVLEESVQQLAFMRMSESFGISNNIVAVGDYAEVFRITAEGRVDAAIVNHLYGNMHAKQYGLVDTSVVFNPSALFFAAAKHQHADLLAAIDRHLSELKKDTRSVYYQSLAKWTAGAVEFSLPSWIWIGAVVVAAVLALSLAISIVFKHKLNERTRELRASNDEMERKIAERTAELAEALERAKAADNIKSAFLATMSHELRTPLNSIIGFTGIMLQGLTGPLNPEQHKQMTMVQNSSRHLLSLINDVLDISKIEAGQLELVAKPFHLGESLEKSVKMLTTLADAKGLQLSLDIADNIGMLIADQRRVEQVVINLVNNAVKFTERGSVTVCCSLDGPDMLIRIRDSGVGIRESDLERLFTPFYQVDSGLTRRYEGTGLGLSICKRLLGLMGGSITVSSEWGKGSEFTVRLPAKLEETDG